MIHTKLHLCSNGDMRSGRELYEDSIRALGVVLHCILVKVYVVMLQLNYIKLLGINVQVLSHLEHWCRLLIVAVLSQQLKCNTAPNPLGFSIASPCIPSLWVTINESQPIQILLVILPTALRDCFHHVFWVLCT